MSKHDDTNTIVLFKNEKRTEENNQAYYRGEVNMEGKVMNVSLWIREASGNGKLPKGTKFLGGELDNYEFKKTDGPGTGNTPATKPPVPAAPSDDDIPF
jgi:hypothetical protein